MATLRIEQFSGASMDERHVMQMPQLPMIGAAVTLTSSGVSSAMASPIDAKTRALRLRCTGTPPIAFRVATSTPTDPLAVVTDISMADGEVVYFGLDPSQVGGRALKVAVIDR